MQLFPTCSKKTIVWLTILSGLAFLATIGIILFSSNLFSAESEQNTGDAGSGSSEESTILENTIGVNKLLSNSNDVVQEATFVEDFDRY